MFPILLKCIDMSGINSKSRKAPSLRFLFSHPAHFVACGFGSGLSPVAPGTAGTLLAWALFLPLRAWLDDAQLAGALALCFALGVPAVQKTGVDLGAADHGSIVWDEIVPFWLVLSCCPPGWAWQGAAFLLFRFFDIVKPQPARYFDARVKNGFGVMADDLFAAIYAILALAAVRFSLGWE